MNPTVWTQDEYMVWLDSLLPAQRAAVIEAARLAPDPVAPHIWQANDVIAVDDVTDGMAHDASGIGFAPLACLEVL